MTVKKATRIGIGLNMLGIIIGNTYRGRFPLDWISTILIIVGCILIVSGIILSRKKK